MKRVSPKIALLNVILFSAFTFGAKASSDQNGRQFSVASYGAKGDGTSDDSKPIQKCFDDASRVSNATILFPSGTYLITSPIQYKSGIKFSLEIKGESGKSKLICNKLSSFFSVSGNLVPNAIVNIHDLTIEGNNPPFSATHPYYNKAGMYVFAIALFNIDKATINNVIIKNIYGEGIYIVNDQRNKAPVSANSTQIRITNNRILNCWGLHPTLDKGFQDEYGDGIYLSNVSGATIENNIVKNDLNVTKQFGRAGIVLEFNCRNCIINKNQVSGYDRDIHIEGDLGGHIISNNNLTGSEIGVFSSLVCADGSANPITITNNYISNDGIPLNNSFTRVLPMGSRALLSLHGDWKKVRARTILAGNQVVYSNKSDYTPNVLVMTWISYINLKNNVFSQPENSKKKLSLVFGYEIGDLMNNSFNNISDLKFDGVKVKGQKIVTGVKQGNKKTSMTTSNLNF